MNPVVHFEIPAKDKEKFKKFYADVFGWQMIDMPEMNYVMVHTVEIDEKHMPKQVGAINGGMMLESDNGGMFPVLVMDVPNVDEYIKKIEAAGGKVVMPKMQIGDMGYYARFTDPDGVVMGIWETIKN